MAPPLPTSSCSVIDQIPELLDTVLGVSAMASVRPEALELAGVRPSIDRRLVDAEHRRDFAGRVVAFFRDFAFRFHEPRILENFRQIAICWYYVNHLNKQNEETR